MKNNTALVVIDLQNDITKNYRAIIDQVNRAIAWALGKEFHLVYVLHHNITEGTRTFKPGTRGAELVPELNVASQHIFAKTKANALTSEPFDAFIEENQIREFYVVGADATACIKSTCFNMTKAGFKVHVIKDCVTSYDLKKLEEMYTYYEKKGCEVQNFNEL